MSKRRTRLSDYVPVDPTLAAYDHGLGALRFDGELQGYLASVLGEIQFPSRAPWVWFVVVRNDGTKETPFEDYGPGWPTVRELDSGFFDHFEQGTRTEGRFLGFTTVSEKRGAPCRYEFSWLPADEAAQKWTQLGLVDSDF